MSNLDIRGRWNVLAWEQIYDDGRVVHPMGKELEGFIEYGEYGMFCVIAKAGRANFTTGGQWSASDAEKAAAYNGYLSYAGGYEVQGNVVLHHVRYSLCPDWKGGVQRRVASFDGEVLTLEARLEEGSSEARTARLTWKKQA